MTDKPQVAVFWMTDAPIANDPLAAVKRRARAHVEAAAVLAEVTRSAEVTDRADAIDQAADLFLDDAFDPGDTWDFAAAAGMSDQDLDSAGNVALILARIERDGTA